MKSTMLLLLDHRIRRHKAYGRSRKTKEHRCERRKVKEMMHRWDLEEAFEDPS